MIGLKDDIYRVSALQLPWDKLRDKTVLISGASGMIGSFLIYVLLSKKENIRVIAVGRSEVRAKERFQQYWEDKNFLFILNYSRNSI